MSKLARFARTQGARDKKKRRSRMLRNIAIGLGGTALLGGAAYLGRGKIAGLMGKGKPPAATGGGSPRPPAPNPPSSGGGGSPPPPTPKSPSPSGGGSPQPKTNPVESGRQSQPPAPKPKKKLSSKEKLELRRKATTDYFAQNKNPATAPNFDDYLEYTTTGNRPIFGDYAYSQQVNNAALKEYRQKIKNPSKYGGDSYDAASKAEKLAMVEKWRDSINEAIRIKKGLATNLKAVAQKLSDRGLYYSSGLPITAFSQHKPTMMSLASFNRKYSQGKN